MRKIKLSRMEVTYLVNGRFLAEDLVQMIGIADPVDSGARLLKLDRDVAERFRDELTTRLAKFGFDSDYEPTREGKLLEDLIERFATRE